MEKDSRKYSLDDLEDIDNLDDIDLDDIDDIDDIYDFDSELDDIDDDIINTDKKEQVEEDILRDEVSEKDIVDKDDDVSEEDTIIKKFTVDEDDEDEEKVTEEQGNKKKLAIIIAVAAIVIIIILFLLKGCGQKYTITFDSNGGTEVTEQKIKKDGTVSKPKDPTREGYTFDGWYLNGEKYDFNTKVDGNIELEAKWTSGNAAAVKSVTLDQTSVTISPEDTILLVAIIEPADARDQIVEWSSSDEEVATVDSNGNVTALKEGTAIITVTTNDGGYKAACAVTVSGDVVPVTGITLSTSELELDTGDIVTIGAEITPNDATNKGVVWTSSDTSVVKVVNGSVTAIGEGSATITATTKDGGFKETVSVTVKDVPLRGVSLMPSKTTIVVGDKKKLTPTFNPTNATNKNVTWKSSAPDVVKVDSNGNIEALSTGEATITIKTEEGSKTAVSHITVKKSTIKIEADEILTYVGDSLTLKATVGPTEALDKTVSWTSSDEKVATVNNKGVVTGVSNGVAVITAESSYGVKETITITVKPAPMIDEITILGSDRLKVGDETTLTANIEPANASNKKLTWSSDDESIATVDENGKVTAHKTGMVVITVKLSNDVTDTHTIDVFEEQPRYVMELTKLEDGSYSVTAYQNGAAIDFSSYNYNGTTGNKGVTIGAMHIRPELTEGKITLTTGEEVTAKVEYINVE